MKSKPNKIIFILICIVIAIIIIISSIIILLSKKKVGTVYIEEPKEEDKNIEATEEKETISEAMYYSIARIVNKYYNCINKDRYGDREENNFAEDETVKKSIYDLISKEYIEKNQIEIDNIYDYVPKINGARKFIPTSIEVVEGFLVDKYLVKGTLIYIVDEDNYDEVQVFVNVDNKNNAFSIEPIMQVENGDIQIKNSEQEIEQTNYNTFELEDFDDQDLAKEKFDNLKLLLLRKSEKLYDMFDEEYSSKKFENYQGYVKYIEDNYERLSTMYIKQYKVKDYDDYKQYICLDQNGNYFIFNTADANDTKIILDTYTVDLPEFVEKYNKANDSTKVGYNIERFVSAINDQDYKYAYNCLDEVYRKNNMPTLEYFENYIKRNLYDKNKVEHTSMEKQGNNYIAEITIKDEDNSSSTGKKLTVIMRLGEETDFAMSFSMN